MTGPKSLYPPLGFATLLFLFCWFPGFVFWDWMGRKRRDAVQQAEFLYTGIISFKTAVLPSKSSIISKKCGRFHLQNARFISECSILFEGHQLLLQKVQYFLKRRRILSIYAVFFETSSNLKNVLQTFQCPVLPQKVQQFSKNCIYSLISNVSCTKYTCLSQCSLPFKAAALNLSEQHFYTYLIECTFVSSNLCIPKKGRVSNERMIVFLC